MSKNKYEETEVVYTDIDVADIERRLVEIGAKKVADTFHKNTVLDYADLRLNAKGGWIRLRDDGTKVELAYKQRLGMNQGDGEGEDTGMKEIDQMILELGLDPEKKRIINNFEIYRENEINVLDYQKILFSGLEKKGKS